jgi:potassium/hydrogen antiporter
MTEPNATALILFILGALIVLSAGISRLAGRTGLPVTLLFLALGMLAGSEGLGRVDFEDYALSVRLGTVALVLILFDGGLNTSMAAVRRAWAPAAVLASAGVVLTAAAVAGAGMLFGMPWKVAGLLGAIISSTDAAAVFAILRGSRLHLRRRVGATLELESGLNDPMAVILTMTMIGAFSAEGISVWTVARDTLIQLGVGAGLGFAFGIGGREVLKRARVSAAGLYPVLTIGLAFLAFGLPTLFLGSGFLAVYVSAILIGNADIRYRSGILRVHDGIAWFSQVTMFLMLGLLVFPSKLIAAAPMGMAIWAVLVFVARPLAVFACVAPFKFGWLERVYMSWVGLRGAVPIVLATFPVLAGVPEARSIFNLVFFVVVGNAFAPGATVPWVTRLFKQTSDAPSAPAAVLEIASTDLLSAEVVGLHVNEASAVNGAKISELPLPESATAAMIVRGKELIAPRGSTTLKAGDHVYLLVQREDLPLVTLLFGQVEAD